jgi:NTE family protein
VNRRGKVCVVLGGGGARGLAHLGVLQVLEREGVPIDCLVGTSVGAVVGATYALDPDALAKTRQAIAYFHSDAFAGNAFKKIILKSDDVEQSFLRGLLNTIRKGYIFSSLLRRQAIFPGEKLLEVISDLVPDKNFEDAVIPFAVPALDLCSGREVLLKQGSLRQAVFASSSLPGFFPPVRLNGMVLADAGVIGPVPVKSAIEAFQPSTVIAVDISSYLTDCELLARGLDVILRVESIACSRLNSAEISSADVVIRPEVGGKYWSDFSELEGLVNAGVVAAQEKLEEIRAAMARGRKRTARGAAPSAD